MNPLIRKELRLLAPAWGAAVVLVILGCWVAPRWIIDQHTRENLSLICFGLGVLLVSLSTFGGEFSLGTFSQLLAQPAERRRIWNTKIAISGAALLSILTLACLLWALNKEGVPTTYVGVTDVGGVVGRLWTIGLASSITVAAFGGGLWTTLLLRQVTAAFWLAAGIPGTIACASTLLEVWKLEDYQSDAIVAALLAYAAVSFLVARRLFFRAQDAQWTGGNIAFPTLVRGLRAPLFMRQNAVGALIRKELQLHSVSVFMALGLVVLSGMGFVLHKLFQGGAVWADTMNEVLVMNVWVVVPLLVGGSAVAEERKFNTLEGLLCLPFSRRLQFTIKLIVTIVVGVVLGGLLPAFMARMIVRDGFGPTVLGFCVYSAALTGVAFYASTLTRNILQAIVATVCVGLLGALFVPATVIGFYTAIYSAFSPYMRNGHFDFVFFKIGGAFFGLALLCLAYGNFKRPRMDRHGWVANILVIAVAWGLFSASLAGVHYRAWEFFMTWEPRHGAARLDAGKICSGTRPMSLFALLPDGRLWAATQFQFKGERFIGNRGLTTIEIVEQTPVAGHFISQSNWVDIAANRKVYGVQSNGTLWSCELPTPTLPKEPGMFFGEVPSWQFQQVGTDSDWKAISAGHIHCLALKRDGTLWGWGYGDQGELGPGIRCATNGPVRIGRDADWVSVFAQEYYSCGVKADGTVWRWGSMITSPDGRYFSSSEMKHPEFVRLPFVGESWLGVQNSDSSTMALRADGALFVVGAWNTGMFGFTPGGGTNSIPHQIGKSEWRSLAGNSWLKMAVKKDGTFLVDLAGSRFRRPSKYHDWLAASMTLGGRVVGLAADGTLSCWEVIPNEYVFGPSRRALWSVNIFEEGR